MHKAHYQAISVWERGKGTTHIQGVKARETSENGPKTRISIDFNIATEEVYLRSLDED